MKKIFLAIGVAVCLTGAASTQTAGTITQNDILSRIGDHEDIRQALLNLSIRESGVSIESLWKGLQVTVTPSTQFDDAAAVMELFEASVGADAALPLGLSAADRERKTQAGESYDIARFQLEEAFGNAYTELFSLYGESFLAQEAAMLAEREAALASLQLEATRTKAQRGLASVSDEADSEAAYQAAGEKVIQANLDRRLSWLNLAYASKMESGTVSPQAAVSDEHLPSPGMGLTDIPLFTAPAFSELLKNVPQPGVLMAKAKEASSLVRTQAKNLAVARRSLDSHSSLNLNFTPKILYANPDVSASLAYSTASGTVNLGSSWKTYENPAAASGGTQPPENSITLSIGISGTAGPQGAAEKEQLASLVMLEERKLQALEESIELTVRSRYASFLKAKDSLAAAERANAFAAETAAVTKTRSALGQTSPVDEAASVVLLLRADYNVKKAGVDLTTAYFSLIASANAWDIAGIPLTIR